MHPDPEALSRVPLFAGLDAEHREVLSAWLDVDERSAGTLLTREGSSDYAFFILDSGTARVERDGTVIDTLGPGDPFGEVAFFTARGRRTATVVATSDVRVLTMFGTRFREMQQDLPEVAARLEALFQARVPPAPEG